LNIRTKTFVEMILIIVAAFILGGIVTYYLFPPEFSVVSSTPAPPPWSPRADGRDGPNRMKPPDSEQREAEAEQKAEDRRKRFIDRWKKKLDLTDEQVDEFHQIFTAGHKKFVAVDETSREQYARIRKETDEELIKVLTPEQATKYREIVEAYRNRLRNREENDRPRNQKRD